MVSVSPSSTLTSANSNRRLVQEQRSLIAVVAKYIVWIAIFSYILLISYNQTITTQNDLENVAPVRTRVGQIISSSSSTTSSVSSQYIRSSSSSTSRSTSSSEDFYYNTNNKQCRYYMAESAIPHGGIALFTANDLQEGEEAQPMPDICIYVADTPEERTSFHTHSWSGSKFIGQFEGGNSRGACEGVATLVNHVPNFDKVGPTSKLQSMHHHTNGGLHRLKDAGAGAITQYYGITSKAVRHVPAGSELTIEYGDWHSDPNDEVTIPIRDVEWLRQYGMCVDNIVIQNTTIDDTDSTKNTVSGMGRGAYARYDMKAGSLVAPAPIQMFPNRSMFAKQDPEALFVNYCFQPKNSDILLYPYGPGVNLINHGSDLKANVKIDWSKHYLSHTSWLTLQSDQFWQMQYPGSILIDYIAIRDISAGEELLLDYGTEWEAAWDDHVANWTPNTDVTDYTYVDEIDRSQPFRTLGEQQTEPYSKNLHSVCKTGNWDRKKYSVMKWTQSTNHIVYCTILSRKLNEVTDEYEYTVALNFHSQNPEHMDLKRYIDKQVPHSAISFVDKPYMSDIHLKNSFRHPMILPDHMTVTSPFLQQ